MLGNDHLSNTSAKVITIKTLFASAKPSAIANCWGEFRGLEVWPTQKYNYVLKMSWWHMAKMNILVWIKMSWRRLQDVFWRQRPKTPSRCLHQDKCLVGTAYCIISVFASEVINFYNFLEFNSAILSGKGFSSQIFLY